MGHWLIHVAVTAASNCVRGVPTGTNGAWWPGAKGKGNAMREGPAPGTFHLNPSGSWAWLRAHASVVARYDVQCPSHVPYFPRQGPHVHGFKHLMHVSMEAGPCEAYWGGCQEIHVKMSGNGCSGNWH